MPDGRIRSRSYPAKTTEASLIDRRYRLVAGVSTPGRDGENHARRANVKAQFEFRPDNATMLAKLPTGLDISQTMRFQQEPGRGLYLDVSGWANKLIHFAI